jgi:putative transposase
MQVENPIKKYKSDKRLVYSCQYHVIFCPKYRRKVLKNGIDTRIKDLIEEKQNTYNYTILSIEVMPDHVHLLLDINPRIGVYSVISKIKGYTSHQLREEFPELKTKLPCLWTNSNFISTCGSVSLEVVKQYIEDQKGT